MHKFRVSLCFALVFCLLLSGCSMADFMYEKTTADVRINNECVWQLYAALAEPGESDFTYYKINSGSSHTFTVTKGTYRIFVKDYFDTDWSYFPDHDFDTDSNNYVDYDIGKGGYVIDYN
jgi:major membrane immunogen (membrane-anchored lipoprotein)